MTEQPTGQTPNVIGYCKSCHWFDVYLGPLGSRSAQCSHHSYILNAVPVPLDGSGFCHRFEVDTRTPTKISDSKFGVSENLIIAPKAVTP